MFIFEDYTNSTHNQCIFTAEHDAVHIIAKLYQEKKIPKKSIISNYDQTLTVTLNNHHNYSFIILKKYHLHLIDDLINVYTQDDLFVPIWFRNDTNDINKSTWKSLIRGAPPEKLSDYYHDEEYNQIFDEYPDYEIINGRIIKKYDYESIHDDDEEDNDAFDEEEESDYDEYYDEETELENNPAEIDEFSDDWFSD